MQNRFKWFVVFLLVLGLMSNECVKFSNAVSEYQDVERQTEGKDFVLHSADFFNVDFVESNTEKKFNTLNRFISNNDIVNSAVIHSDSQFSLHLCSAHILELSAKKCLAQMYFLSLQLLI